MKEKRMEPQSHKAHKDAQRDLSVENPISKVIVDCAYQVHKKIGPGLLENAYQECLSKELSKREVTFEAEKTLTYLKLSSLKMALLINFSSPLIKDGIRRFVL